MIQRSSFGLRNRNLFSNSDITVYTEANAASLEADRLDHAFWRQVIMRRYGNVRVKFEARGNKKSLIEIIGKLKADEGGMASESVVICLDRDFDDISEIAHDEDFVIYSYGYSIENDIYHKNVIHSFIKNIIGDDEKSDDAVRIYRSEASDFIKKFRQLYYHDYAVRGQGGIDRKRYKKYITIRRGGPLYYNDDLIAGDIGPENQKNSSFHRRLFGHLYSYVSFHMVSNSVSKYTRTKLRYWDLERSLIQVFFQLFESSDEPVFRYYKSLCR